MGQLFGKSKSTINEHVLHIYEEGELAEEKTKRKIGNSDFSTKPTNYYNLDVIISVGYRVKSIQGTRFRQWATERLHEYIVKGSAQIRERVIAARAIQTERFKGIKGVHCNAQMSARHDHISFEDVTEAVGYRNLDRGDWAKRGL